MIKVSFYKLKPLKYVVAVWDENSPDPPIREIVTRHNKDVFLAKIKNKFQLPANKHDWITNPVEATLKSLFVMHPSLLSQELPGVTQREKHPIDGSTSYLQDIIMDLNDTHKWTRDQIADWIETLENVPTFGEKNDL